MQTSHANQSQTVDTVETHREEDTAAVDSRLNVSAVSVKSDCTSGSDCNMQTKDSSLIMNDSESRPTFKTEFSEPSSTKQSPRDCYSIHSPLPPVPKK